MPPTAEVSTTGRTASRQLLPEQDAGEKQTLNDGPSIASSSEIAEQQQDDNEIIRHVCPKCQEKGFTCMRKCPYELPKALPRPTDVTSSERRKSIQKSTGTIAPSHSLTGPPEHGSSSEVTRTGISPSSASTSTVNPSILENRPAKPSRSSLVARSSNAWSKIKSLSTNLGKAASARRLPTQTSSQGCVLDLTDAGQANRSDSPEPDIDGPPSPGYSATESPEQVKANTEACCSTSPDRSEPLCGNKDTDSQTFSDYNAKGNKNKEKND